MVGSRSSVNVRPASARSCEGSAPRGAGPPRADADVSRDGTVIGRTSSGNFSPTLGFGIALAFVDPAVEPGDEVSIDLRGTPLTATCVELPFLPKH